MSSEPATKKHTSPKTKMASTNRPRKSPKTATLSVDCRGIFGEKNSRVVEIPFVIRDNKLTVRIHGAGKYIEVGRIEQLRMSDYFDEVGVRTEYVWCPSDLTDCYRMTLDKETIDELYNHRRTLTVDDLSLVYGYLHYKETQSFYDICLMDYSELPQELEVSYADGKDYEFIVVRNEQFPVVDDIGYKVVLH